jgi:CheY-like chemotaxis protein
LIELTHQGLQKIINNRHKDLQSEIAAIKARKRGGYLSEGVSDGLDQDDDSEVKIVTILHVEDNQTVAEAVKETLEIQGWQVDTYTDGNTALQKIESDADYDVLLLDYDLPGVNGLELVRHARDSPAVYIRRSWSSRQLRSNVKRARQAQISFCTNPEAYRRWLKASIVYSGSRDHES